MKKYFLNTKTHRLHIYGYCKETKHLPCHVEFFDTEDEALSYDGRSLGVCKICQREHLDF